MLTFDADLWCWSYSFNVQAFELFNSTIFSSMMREISLMYDENSSSRFIFNNSLATSIVTYIVFLSMKKCFRNQRLTRDENRFEIIWSCFTRTMITKYMIAKRFNSIFTLVLDCETIFCAHWLDDEIDFDEIQLLLISISKHKTFLYNVLSFSRNNCVSSSDLILLSIISLRSFCVASDVVWEFQSRSTSCSSSISRLARCKSQNDFVMTTCIKRKL